MLKTNTDYDRVHMEELQRVAGKTFAKEDVRRKRVIALGVAGIFLGGGAGLAVWKGVGAVPILLCVVGVLALLWSVFYYPFTGWGSSLNLGSARNGNEFFFEKRGILAMRGGESARYPYEDCSMLLEAERSFYFFTQGGQGMLLDKENIQGGTADDLRAWLEEKCGRSVTWAGRKRDPAGADGKE